MIGKERRLGRARNDAVHADSVRGKVDGSGMHKGDLSTFGSRVTGVSRIRKKSVAGGSNNDASRFLLLHILGRGFGSQKSAGKIGRDHGVPILFGEIEDRLVDLNGSVGIKNIDLAESLDHLGKTGFDLFLIADIGLEEEGTAALGLDLRHRLIAGFFAAVQNDDMLAIASEKQRRVLADSGTSTRDNDYTIAQFRFPFRLQISNEMNAALLSS